MDPPELVKARSEKTRLIDELTLIERDLAKVNEELKTTRPKDIFQGLMKRKNAFVSRRNRVIDELREAKKRLSALEDEKKDFRTAARNSEEWDGTVELAKGSFRELVQYVSFLEQRVVQLTEEIERLTGTEIPL